MALRNVKLVLVGDTQTGKSAVLLRMTHTRIDVDQFSGIKPTIGGADFGSRKIEIGDQTINLQIWDTSGQERFQLISKGYYRYAEAVFVFYNIEDQRSFQNIDRYINQARESVSQNCVVTFVGTHSHSNMGVVTLEDAKQKARDLGFDDNFCFEVSAETGEGIEEMISVVARKVVEVNQLKPVVNQVENNEALNAESSSFMVEAKKKSGFLSFLNKHKWAILFGVLLTAGIVAASVVFWPVIVATAAVTSAAAAISALTAQIGFIVSATAFAATAISVAGAAVVTAASFILDKVISAIKNTVKSNAADKDQGYSSVPSSEDEGRSYKHIAQGMGADLTKRNGNVSSVEAPLFPAASEWGASGFKQAEEYSSDNEEKSKATFTWPQ